MTFCIDLYRAGVTAEVPWGEGGQSFMCEAGILHHLKDSRKLWQSNLACDVLFRIEFKEASTLSTKSDHVIMSVGLQKCVMVLVPFVSWLQVLAELIVLC